jgi:hypothetical protein
VRLMRVGIALAGLVAVPVLAACSAGGHARASASASPTALSDARLQVLVNDLVACIRAHGAPGMPDVPVRGGKVVEPDQNTLDQATRQNFDAARTACKQVEDRIPPAALGESPKRGPTAADVPKLRQFAQCMRGNGFPDWPDPRADGSFPIAGTALQTEGKSPRFRAATEACKKYWSDGFRFS